MSDASTKHSCFNKATVLARAKMLHVSNQQLTVQTHRSRVTYTVIIEKDRWVGMIDASWYTNGKAGMGIMWYNQQGRLTRAQAAPITAINATQAEATVLYRALVQTKE